MSPATLTKVPPVIRIAVSILALTYTAIAAAGDAKNPLELSLRITPNLLVGQRPKVWLSVRNVSGDSVEYVRPLDRSLTGRFPRIDLKIIDQQERPVHLKIGGAMCGTARASKNRISPASSQVSMLSIA